LKYKLLEELVKMSQVEILVDLEVEELTELVLFT
jgi:hypothetical protein